MRAIRSGAEGQSTVELALCLPVLAAVLGLVVEVGMVAADQVRLWHAAREGARAAVVDPNGDAARQAVDRSGLEGVDLRISPNPAYRVQGEPLRVELSYQPRSRIPLVGEIVEGFELHADATMRIEEP